MPQTKDLAKGATAPTNGNGKEKLNTAPPAASQPAPQTGTSGKVTPLPILNSPKKEELDELPPVEDRVLKVQQLFSVVEKLETLQELKKKLKAFKLSSDGSGDYLKLTDSKGNTFQTSNSACLADVLDVLKTTIDKKIVEAENQIRF